MSSGIAEDSLAPRAPARPRVLSRIIRWRNWNLSVKLTAVVLVPLTFALAVGALQIRGQIRQANEYTRLDGVVSTANAVRSTAALLQDERTAAARFLATGPNSSDTLREAFAATDAALKRALPTMHAHAGDEHDIRFAPERDRDRVAEIAALRQRITTSGADPAGAIDSYNRIIDSFLELDRVLISEVSSTQLGNAATRLQELARIGQEMRLQQAWVLVGVLGSEFTTRNIAELEASETRRLTAVTEFRAAAAHWERAGYDRLYNDPAFSARENSLRHAISSGSVTEAETSPPPLALPAAVWDEQSRAALGSLRTLQERVEAEQHRTASVLKDNASDLAGLESVLLMSALLIASAIVILFARQLLGSLDALRRSALDTAHIQLPRALAEVRAGNGSRVGIARIPIGTTEEVGQLARAFDDVQKQAVSLAAEQAELRKHYGDSFINVARRSQSLLERQLRLFEQLERDEEDPDQLATLFQLDHLATRMRRNNENLMVLSGSDLTRRFNSPTTPADLVRAAISEIEHYPRVVVQPLPDARIVGYAANDLVRLLAELLDNAANFSAPDTTVTVSGHRLGDGSIGLDLVDRGIGMSDAELAAANQRLTEDRELELSTSRRMGLFVAGRLANRHGIEVRLYPGPDRTGVRVTVGLRAELVLDASAHSRGRTNGAARPAAPGTRTNLAEPAPEKPASEREAGDTGFGDTSIGDTTRLPVPIRNGFHLLAEPGQESSANGKQDEPGAATSHHPKRQSAPGAQEGAAVPAPLPEDTTILTPIFDNLASAWFQPSHPQRTRPESGDVRWPADSADRETSPPSEDQLDLGEGDHWSSTSRWKFTSDDAALQSATVSSSAPTEYTSVGLPLRVPRANLVTDGAGPNGSGDNAVSYSDADTKRRRMSSFQQGVWLGRRKEDRTLPPTEDSGARPAEWAFQADTAAQQAEAALNREPDEFTPAGLPRRTPRAQLAPGAADGSPPHEVSPQRDADAMRGRLASFQRGVREGKHSRAEPDDTADER